MKAVHGLILLDLWGNNRRDGNTELQKLSVELNPVSVMLFNFQIPAHALKWEDREECMGGYTEVFYIDGSKTNQGTGAGYKLGVVFFFGGISD